MKSIIGYYKPPLTQEERDCCLAYILPMLDDIYTELIIYNINKLISKVMKEADGDFLQAGLTEMMTDKINKELREYAEGNSQIPIMQKFSVTFGRSGKNSVVTVMSKELQDVIDKKVVLRNPKFNERWEVSDDNYICEQYNNYLIKNPDKRVVYPTPFAVEVNEANNRILERLERHGYVSQTNNKLFDLSDIIIDIKKESC